MKEKGMDTIFPPLKFKKGKNLISFSLDDAQNIAIAAEKEYPCFALAFRLARIAFRYLGGDVAEVNGLKVVSYLPPEAGSRLVFEFIVAAANVKYKGNWNKVTPESYMFVFTNELRNLALHIWVKESTFKGAGFFDLRNRVVNNKATSEEKKLLLKYFQETLSNLLTKPDEELFIWKEVSI